MKRKLIITVLVLSLFLVILAGCSSNKNEEVVEENNDISEDVEEVSEEVELEEKEWYEEYDNYKIVTTYVWAENVSANGLLKESADFIDKKDELFPSDNKEKVTSLINKDITYKHIEKSSKKYATKLFQVKGLVINIEELDLEEFGIATSLHVLDEEMQSYDIMYFGELPDVFKEDVVYVVGLPIGMGGFENVSGGFTNTVVTLGSYIEKIE